MPMPSSPLARLGAFRTELHACLTRRGDALFELGDALLCAPAIPSVAQLSLEPIHRRGRGGAAVRVRCRLRLRPAHLGPDRAAGGGAGAAARGPLLLRRPATPATGQDRPATPARR